MSTDTTTQLSPAVMAWVTELLHDVLTDDFMGEYQRVTVGPIPTEVVAAFGLDADDMAEMFGPSADDGYTDVELPS